MGFDITLESVSEEGLVWKTKFCSSQVGQDLCTPLLCKVCYLWFGLRDAQQQNIAIFWILLNILDVLDITKMSEAEKITLDVSGTREDKSFFANCEMSKIGQQKIRGHVQT